MNKKEKCSEIMGRIFGPATGELVLSMSEPDDEIISDCRRKTVALLGEAKAKEFDNI